MGNYSCCAQKKQTKKRSKITSIRTTTSIQARFDIFCLQDLEQQFRDQYDDVLHILRQNHGYSCFNPSFFNISVLSKLGTGAHSQVYLVKTDYQTHEMEMALKIIPKTKICSSSLRKSIAMENLLLHHNSSPFLMNSLMNREDQNNIYFFMPVAEGGDLISYTQDSTGKGLAFAQNQEQNIRFIAAGVILGLEYIHKLGLILNDLKLQNILIDKQGYPILTDFGLIESQKSQYFSQPVGTIVYLSPEKVEKLQYNKAVDFWALGILLYILTYREYPFDEQIIKEQKNFIREVEIKEKKHKKKSIKGSDQLKDLINSLICRNPFDRLGVINIQDLKKHAFFSGINWEQYQNKTIQSPLKSIVNKFPFRGVCKDQKVSNYKVFRQQSIEDEYLYTLGSKLKLKKTLCKTNDRLSAPYSQLSQSQIDAVSNQLFSSGSHSHKNSEEFL